MAKIATRDAYGKALAALGEKYVLLSQRIVFLKCFVTYSISAR